MFTTPRNYSFEFYLWFSISFTDYSFQPSPRGAHKRHQNATIHIRDLKNSLFDTNTIGFLNCFYISPLPNPIRNCPKDSFKRHWECHYLSQQLRKRRLSQMFSVFFFTCHFLPYWTSEMQGIHLNYIVSITICLSDPENFALNTNIGYYQHLWKFENLKTI